MKGKYLPIGSVVNVNGIAKKIMIVGYYSIEYSNNVKMYDYIGISYPEGMLLKDTYSFNHSDIISIDFMGYPAEDYQVLNAGLQQQQITASVVETDSSKNFVNLKFDANGVIVSEEIGATQKPAEIVNNGDVNNPFVVKNQAPSTGKKPKFSFDENGVVTGEAVENDIAKIESNFKFGFDANGVITEENSTNAEQPVEEKPVYKFDANGFIIDDGSGNTVAKEEVPSKPTYKFDANGVITGEESTNSSDSSLPEYHYDEGGITITG